MHNYPTSLRRPPRHIHYPVDTQNDRHGSVGWQTMLRRNFHACQFGLRGEINSSYRTTPKSHSTQL